MKKEEIKYFCDICKKETNYEGCFRVNYPVIFTTNQTDGVASKPYIEHKQIDICRDCADKVLKITASGCQGYNEYKVINEDPKWQELKKWLKERNRKNKLHLKAYEFEYIDVLIKMQELEGEDDKI